MKIAIIDDSLYKIDSIQRILSAEFSALSISVAKSFQTGLRLLESGNFDLVILDMSLPTQEKPDGRLGGRNRIYGGRELMAEMVFLDLNTKVIVVSQFEAFRDGEKSWELASLLKELQQEFPHFFLGGVFFSTVDSRWESELVQLLNKAK